MYLANAFCYTGYILAMPFVLIGSFFEEKYQTILRNESIEEVELQFDLGAKVDETTP